MKKKVLATLLALLLLLQLPLTASAGVVSAYAGEGVSVVVQYTANGTGTHRVTASTLNIRSGPSTSAEVIGRLTKGTLVSVTGLVGDFAKIAATGSDAYVSRKYLDPVSPTTKPTVKPTATPKPTATVRPTTKPTTAPSYNDPDFAAGMDAYRVTGSTVNVRASASTSGTKITTVKKNDIVYLVSRANAEWSRIRLKNGTFGYISSQYITYDHTAADPQSPTLKPTTAPTMKPTTKPTATVKPTATPKPTATGKPTAAPAADKEIYQVTASSLNVRNAPSTTGTKLTVVHSGDLVTLLSKPSSEWYRVQLADGRVGYVSAQYLRYLRTEYAPTEKPTLAPTNVPTSAPTTVPTVKPTTAPTLNIPTLAPTTVPTVKPTTAPTLNIPTLAPTTAPTVKPTTAPTATPATRQIYQVTASSLNVRTSPSSSGAKLTVIHSGDLVTVLSKPNSEWYEVQLSGGQHGYVSAQYVRYLRTETDTVPTVKPTTKPTVKPTATPRPTATVRPTATPTVRPTATPVPLSPQEGLIEGDVYRLTANVYLRSGPSTSYSNKGIYQKNSYVNVVSKYSSSWYYVRTPDGKYGYMSAQYLTFYTHLGAQPTPTPVPQNYIDTTEQIYTPAQLREDISKLKDAYPNLVTKVVSIGNSMWNTQIPAVCIGNPNASKALLIDGAIHAREYMSTLLMMKQMEYILQNSGMVYNGRTVSSMLQDCCIWFIPMINPDGVQISQSGTLGLNATLTNNLIVMNGGSTNFTRWKANGYGVDLNRNFDALWVKLSDGPAPEGYAGAHAESESETQAMVSFVRSHSNIKASINYHTTGNYIYWHFNQTGTQRTRDKRIADKLKSLTGYYLMPEDYSDDGGGFMDWMIYQMKLPSFTIELGPGNVAAPQPISYFNAIWKANRDVPLLMLDTIINELN